MNQIDDLLHTCEQGTLSRRQLLQTLGLAGAAVFGAGALRNAAAAFAVQTGAAGNRPFPATHVNHLAYRVADYAKSRDFYMDLFGMRNAWDDSKGSALEFGDLKSPNGIYIRPSTDGKPSVDHIAFAMNDFMTHKMAMKAEFERRGLQNLRPDAEVGWIVDDPTGYMLNVVITKSPAMFPGAGQICIDSASQKCKDAYAQGMKNIEAGPKPSGRAFKAYAYSTIELHVADIPKAKEFYTNVLGMKVVSEDTSEVALRFGQNTLNLRKATRPDNKSSVERFGYLVENYDHAKVKAELNRRGLNPQQASKMAWSIKDPNGFPIEVAGRVGGGTD